MVRASLFGKYHKTWGMILGDSIFLLFLVYSTDLNIHCSGSFSHHIKFRCSFMHILYVYALQDFHPGGLCKWYARQV